MRFAGLLLVVALGTGCAASGLSESPPSTSTPPVPTVTGTDEENDVLVTPVPRKLASLGDSFASGVGARAMTPTCGRSTLGWPGILAESLGMDYVNAACSGATVEDTFAQIPSLPVDTAVVAVSVGGNTLKFANVVALCLADECLAGWELANSRLDLVQEQTTALLKELLRALPKVSTVLLMLYPPTTNPALECGKITLEFSELFYRGTTLLNTALENAAAEAVASGVPVTVVRPSSFADHTLCSSEEWFHNLNKGMFFMHPNEHGYDALADAALQAVLNKR